MPFPTAAGTPSHSGTVTPNRIWSGKLLVKFYDATVFGEIANTEYEGEINSMGDQVEIRTTPTIEIHDYTKGMTLATQSPEPDVVELTIDKGKYWNFIAHDVDKYQSDYDFIEDWTRDASEQLKINIDTDILGSIYADAHASNAGATAGAKSASFNMGVTGTPVALTKTNILDYIVDMGSVLDEQSVPESDRWLVLPPAMCGLIKKSDLKDASLSGDGTSIMRNGRIGMIDRFTIYNSNLLSTTVDGANTVTNLVAGHKSALTFASQLLENETIRSESAFGSKFRGLQVFGYDVLKSQALVHGYAYKA